MKWVDCGGRIGEETTRSYWMIHDSGSDATDAGNDIGGLGGFGSRSHRPPERTVLAVTRRCRP